MTEIVAAKTLGAKEHMARPMQREEEIEIYGHNTKDNEGDNKCLTDGCSLGFPSVEAEAKNRRIVCPQVIEVGPDYGWALATIDLFVSSHSRNGRRLCCGYPAMT